MNKKEMILQCREIGYRALWDGVFITGKDGDLDYLEEHVRKDSDTYLLDDLLNKSEEELDSIDIAAEKQALVHYAMSYYPFKQHDKIQIGSKLLIQGFTDSNQYDKELLLFVKNFKEFKHLNNVNDIKEIIIAQMKCAYDFREDTNLFTIINIHPEFVFKRKKNNLDKEQWYINLIRKQ